MLCYVCYTLTPRTLTHLFTSTHPTGQGRYPFIQPSPAQRKRVENRISNLYMHAIPKTKNSLRRSDIFLASGQIKTKAPAHANKQARCPQPNPSTPFKTQGSISFSILSSRFKGSFVGAQCSGVIIVCHDLDPGPSSLRARWLSRRSRCSRWLLLRSRTRSSATASL